MRFIQQPASQSNDRVRATLVLKKEQLEKLKTYAYLEKMDISEVMEEVLERHIEKHDLY